MARPIRTRGSELSTPGHSTKMIAKAAASHADLVFLDLEDAVAPAAKAASRKNIVAGLNELDWGDSVRSYRINSVDTPWCHDDLIEVVTGAGANIDVIILPKIKGPREVWFVDDLLTQLERKLGLEVGRIGIEVLIEEVQALQRVDEIATASPRLEALILGVGDLSASQGMRAGHIGVAAGDDAFAATFAMLGGVGKWCIHPSQIESANRVFAPTPDEIEQAVGAIQAVADAEAQGLGAATYNGMMIDAATARLFQVTVDRAQLCGLLDQPASAGDIQ